MNNNNYIRNDFFITPIFQFENLDLAIKLKKFILNQKITGIESNVANDLKHNLSESNFDFFNNQEPIIIETKNYLEKRLSASWQLLLCLVLAWVFLASSSTPLWDSTGDGSANCVRKQGGQETFEWLCAHEGVVYLAQSESDLGICMRSVSPLMVMALFV